MKKIFLFLFIAVLCKHVGAQCGPYVNYAYCNDTVGMIYYSQFECAPTDMIIWSTGDTAYSVTVPPGTYLAHFFANNINYCTDTITMFHDTWDLTINQVGPGELHFSAYLPFCYTSIFTHPSCEPMMLGSALIVWQDGLPVDTFYNVDCSSWGADWYFALPGHFYDISIYDTLCNCYQSTWMYSPPRTFYYPLMTNSNFISTSIKLKNLHYTIVNIFGQVMEQGNSHDYGVLRNIKTQRTFQPGIYFVIYSDADDNRQVLTDKVMVSSQ